MAHWKVTLMGHPMGWRVIRLLAIDNNTYGPKILHMLITSLEKHLMPIIIYILLITINTKFRNF